ncbi:MAG: hypothetical protein V5A72_03330 [Candidatus Nanohaloarchaea archaeon]
MEFDYKASCLRRVEFTEECETVYSGHRPQAGDLVAVRMTDINDSYHSLDLEGAELVELEEGDIVVGVLGNRAGVKGYVGEVPSRLSEDSTLSLLGAGGLFGEFQGATKELDDPCEAEFIGYIGKDGEILNMKDYGIDTSDSLRDDVKIFAVTSSRMDAGKTTLTSKLIERLSQEFDVGSLKLTGSARERDRLNMLDAGSEISLDFVDAGLPSTVDDPRDVQRAAKGLLNQAFKENLDFVVVEFGAGLISKYCVKEVLKDLEIKNQVFGIGAAALDVVGAYGLENILDDIGYDLDFVSGPITDTEVGKDTIEDNVGVPALNAFYENDMEKATNIVSRNFD